MIALATQADLEVLNSRVAFLEAAVAALQQVPLPVAPPSPSTGTILFTESFNDPNLAARGWYDNAADAGTVPIDGGALRCHFAVGSQLPDWGGAIRHPLAPTMPASPWPSTPSLYVRTRLKFSDSWLFSAPSATTDEMHLLYLLTTESGMWTGPGSATPLTAYLQHRAVGTGAAGSVELQDAADIVATPTPPWPLSSFGPTGAVCGCNGDPGDGWSALDCYGGAGWHNGKYFYPTVAEWSNDPASPAYKGGWHMSATYLQLNTITNGIANADGILRRWFDRQLVLERTTVRFRNAAHPTMAFAQVLLGPYLAAPAVMDQTLWIDELLVATDVVP